MDAKYRKNFPFGATWNIPEKLKKRKMKIFCNILIQALLRAHDDVADRNYGDEVEEESQLFSPPPPLSMFSNMPDQVRLVGIRREKNAPLVR